MILQQPAQSRPHQSYLKPHRRRGGRSRLRSDLYPGSASFGRGDFGRFTFTLNGTYLSRFELQVSPDSPRLRLSGSLVFLPTLTGSLPHTRAFASAFSDGPADTPFAGFNIGATIHYTGQYQDDNILFGGTERGRGTGPNGRQNTGTDHARPDCFLYV